MSRLFKYMLYGDQSIGIILVVSLNKKFEMITLIISEGTLEILQFLSERKVGYFKDLRNLKNMRTGKSFSANTVSSRIKELVDYGAVEKAISTSNRRNVVAYGITDAGRVALGLADKFEGELRKVLTKKSGG